MVQALTQSLVGINTSWHMGKQGNAVQEQVQEHLTLPCLEERLHGAGIGQSGQLCGNLTQAIHPCKKSMNFSVCMCSRTCQGACSNVHEQLAVVPLEACRRICFVQAGVEHCKHLDATHNRHSTYTGCTVAPREPCGGACSPVPRRVLLAAGCT